MAAVEWKELGVIKEEADELAKRTKDQDLKRLANLVASLVLRIERLDSDLHDVKTGRR